MGKTNIEDDVSIGNANNISFSEQWKVFTRPLNETAVTSLMIVTNVSNEKMEMIKTKANGNKNEFAIGLLSLPEYQLC